MRRIVVLGAVLVLGGVVAAVALASIGASRTGELDFSVWVTHHRPSVLVPYAKFVAYYMPPLTMWILGALALIALRIRGRGKDLIGEVAVFVAAYLTSPITKAVVHRSRPSMPPVDRLVAVHDNHSMPSGHTAAAAALMAALTLSVWVARRPVWPAVAVGLVFTALVGFARVVAGVHYVGDVVVATMLAAGVGLLVAAALVRFGVVQRPLSPIDGKVSA